jgi:predicted DNA-binding transcriptional regulator AlpA
VKEQLSRKQQSLILSLLSHSSVDEACKASGVGRSSFYRWLKDDATFRREYADAKSAAFSEAISILAKSATTVAQVLTEIATDKSAPVTGRVSAARCIFEWLNRGIETEAIASDAKLLAEELHARKIKRNER